MSAKSFADKDLHWRKRFKPFRTSKGRLVFPLYYRMVPGFDPERDGEDWYNANRKAYEDKNWEQEHEINFGAIPDGFVYPMWSVRNHVLRRNVRMCEDWKYQCIIDPGVAVTAAIWQAIVPRFQLPDGRMSGGWLIKFDEYYVGDDVPDSKSLSAFRHAEEIMSITQYHCDRILGKTRGGSSRKGGQAWIDTTYMDPSAWRREGSTKDLASVATQYIDAGMSSLAPAMTKDVNGGIERVKKLDQPHKEMLHPNGIEDVDSAGFPVAYAMPWMEWYIREKLGYMRKGGKVVKKKDHLMDCERMGAVHATEMHVAPKQSEQSEAFRKLQKIKKRPYRGVVSATRQRQKRNY